MFRTHKPAGSYWTCASQYQQGRRFRELDVAGCSPPPAKVLCPDSDDEFTGRERAVKRRRVETLGEGFFNGKGLFIFSAVASGAELRETVRRASKAAPGPCEEMSDAEDDRLWADEEDGWEVLRKHAQRRAVPARRQSTGQSKRHALERDASPAKTGGEASPAFQQVSPVKHERQRIRPKLSTNPSEEALAKAAELRARDRSVTAELSRPRTTRQPEAAPVTHSAPPTARVTSSFRQTKVSRRIYPQTPADETLADELRLSRTDSLSRRPRALVIPPLENVSFSSNATVENTPGRAYGRGDAALGLEDASNVRSPIADGLRSNIQQRQRNDIEQPAKSGTHTNTGSAAMELCTVQGTGWTAISDPTPTRLTAAPIAHSTATYLSTSRSVETIAATSRMSRVIKSTPKQSPKPSTGPRRRKTTRKASQNADNPSIYAEQQQLTRSFGAAKPDYISAPASQSGTTPFQYRKKGKGKQEKATSKLRDQTRSEDGYGPDDVPRDETEAGSVEHHDASATSVRTPMPAASTGQSSTVTPRMETSLMSEHINRTLPKEEASARQSSSLKKALKSEMRMSGAEISRAPGDPSSSQPAELPSGYLDENSAPAAISEGFRGKRRSMPLWPGTQVLLDQAQHDLFVSPEKGGVEHTENIEPQGCEQEPGGDEPKPNSQSREQERLAPRPRSQECPMPSTQALMGDWSPWSTVKKPKPGSKRTSSVPSPAAESTAKTPSASKPSRPLRSAIAKNNAFEKAAQPSGRRSSLRFSTSTAKTPVPRSTIPSFGPSLLADTDVLDDSTVLDSSTVLNASSKSSSTLKPRQSEKEPKPGPEMDAETDFDFTTLSFAATNAQLDEAKNPHQRNEDNGSSVKEFSSYTAAQVVREDSNPERTLADLASEYLSTADMRAAMSQA